MKRPVEKPRAQIESFTPLSTLKTSHPRLHLAGLEDMQVELEGLERSTVSHGKYRRAGQA